MSDRAYESPAIRDLGDLREITKTPTQHKYYNSNSDYIYPNGYTFNVS